MTAGVNAANKKQREVYAGNLTQGLVTAHLLTEFFNGALHPCSKDGQPPVISVSMNGDGKFSFIEMRTEELATLAMNLDKVELCGRQINVGRPRGYVARYEICLWNMFVKVYESL
jgi:splicing factor U2AF subunit